MICVVYNKKHAGSDPKIAVLIGRVLTVFVNMIFVLFKKKRERGGNVRSRSILLFYKGASYYYSLVSANGIW